MLILLAWFGASVSAAEPSDEIRVSLDRFRPVADTYGYGLTRSAATLRPGQLGFGAWGRYDLGTVLGPPVGSGARLAERAVLDLHAAVGLHERLSVGLDLPVLLWQRAAEGPSQGTVPGAFSNHPDLDRLELRGAGDLRIEPHFVVRDVGSASPLGLALVTTVTLPTGLPGTLSSEGHVTVEPMVVLEAADGSVRDGEHTVRAALNAGLRIKGFDEHFDQTWGPELVIRAAGAARVSSVVEIGTDVAGVIGWGRDPVEVLPWMGLSPTPEVRLTLGAGLGVNSGVGSPDARFFAGATLRPSDRPRPATPPPDRDGDGIPDDQDVCPDEPEDFDGVDDHDGCPDPDPEPEPEPEPVPEPPPPGEEADTDGDGLPDSVDACPFDAEDFDGFEDEDGCPEADNDGDGILDVADACPDEPETFNGYLDEDGCPDEAPSRVVVTRTALEIQDRIFFDLGRANIQAQSFPILEELARVILDHPHIERIRVEGHTDDVGSDAVNLRLSQQRAEAVRDFLVQQGVEASRLEAVGYGESRPIDTNRTERGRARNRRVEFTILEPETR